MTCLTSCLLQTPVRLLSCEGELQQEQDMLPLKEQAFSCLAIMQEQQHSLKQLVRTRTCPRTRLVFAVLQRLPQLESN